MQFNLPVYTSPKSRMPTILEADDAAYLIRHCAGNGVVTKQDIPVLQSIIEAYERKADVDSAAFSVLERCLYSPKRKDVALTEQKLMYVLLVVSPEDTVKKVHVYYSLDSINAHYPNPSRNVRLFKTNTMYNLTAALLILVETPFEFAINRLRDLGFVEVTSNNLNNGRC